MDEEDLAILRGEQNTWGPYRSTCLIQKVSDGFLGELKTFGVYDIVNKKKVKDMRFCGYLEFAQEGLPEFAGLCGLRGN